MNDTAQPTTFTAELVKLKSLIDRAKLPDELKSKADEMLARLTRMVDTGVYSAEYDRSAHYIQWITSLPWGTYTTDRLDIVAAQADMNATHHGMNEPKDRILEYLSTIKLRMEQGGEKTVHAPAIFLVGLVGTGKTTFAYSLANTMGRQFARIPFGGLGSARDLRGKSRLFAEAEPGAIQRRRAFGIAGRNHDVIHRDDRCRSRHR